MSFLKISDPLKRDSIVKEYLELKKNIRDNFLSERIGEQQLQTDLSKFYKPITETQKATTREITEGLKPIREGIEKLPEAIQPLGKATEDEDEEDEEDEEEEKEEDESVCEIARNYLNKQFRDTTFGIRKEKGHHYIGNQHVIVDNNDIIISKNGERFKGTPGLWELITSREPVDFDKEDKDEYRLMVKTNALHRYDDPTNSHPKANRSNKWKNILGPTWYKKQGFSEEDAIRMTKDRNYRKRLIKKIHKIKSEYEGEGVVVIPSDPNALLERLDLLLASQEAGHTGVRNELVSICDELKRQGVLDTKVYKKLNHLIKK